ncbi:MAG: DUF3179 domain-containing protein [bacterium]|nr:DUF3179 domain-containing protein [bacterium]
MPYQLFQSEHRENSRGRITLGWMIALAFILISAAVIVQTLRMVAERNRDVVGDGLTVESYRFDLSNPLIPADRIKTTGLIKDAVKPLDDPAVMTPEDVERFNEEERGKYLVPGDIVFGVVINGDARAYPLRVLAWHQIANDTLGGEPIAVTYDYLTDSAIVFSRRVSERTLSFGFSGLLFNSNALFYDRGGETGSQGLWSQLLMKAVSGPEAAQDMALHPIACQRVRWDVWKAHQTETTVLGVDRFTVKQYQANPGGNYFGSDELKYSVDPTPSPEWKNKTPIAVIEFRGERRGYPMPVVKRHCVDLNPWLDEWNGLTLRFQYDPGTESAYIECSDAGAVIWHAAWFAWNSFYPDAETVD